MDVDLPFGYEEAPYLPTESEHKKPSHIVLHLASGHKDEEGGSGYL